MKSIKSLKIKILGIILVAVLMSIFQSYLFAQSPEQMSYQAVIHDSEGELVEEDVVNMRISIIRGSEQGPVVYEEYHSPETNLNGLVSIIIGMGEGNSGDFSAIDWGTDKFFIRSEIDLEGSGSYILAITNQMLSVPYALYAKSSGDGNLEAGEFLTVVGNGSITDPYIVGIDTSIFTPKKEVHYVGEQYGGGIVFFVYDEGQHGLIAYNRLTNTYPFADEGVSLNNSNVSMINGEQNTADIISSGGATADFGNGNILTAAGVCNNMNVRGFSDWYLPSYREMALLASQDILLYKVGGNGYDFADAPNSKLYWTSTHIGNAAIKFDFNGDKQGCTTFPCDLNQDLNPPLAEGWRKFNVAPIRSF